MNEGQYLAFRSYLEEIAGQNKQIIGQLQRTNELLVTLVASAPIDVSKRVAVHEANEKLKVNETAPLLKPKVAPYAGTMETDPPPDGDGIMPPPGMSKPKTSTTFHAPKASAKKGK